MYNRIMRIVIRKLYKTMNATNRMDIFHKYEVIGDCAEHMGLRADCTMQEVTFRKLPKLSK